MIGIKNPWAKLGEKVNIFIYIFFLAITFLILVKESMTVNNYLFPRYNILSKKA